MATRQPHQRIGFGVPFNTLNCWLAFPAPLFVMWGIWEP
jgi:hypothetical protein